MKDMETRKEFSTNDIEALLENVRARISQHGHQTALIDVIEGEDALILRFRHPRPEQRRDDPFQHLAGRGRRIPRSIFNEMLAQANRDDEDDRADSHFESCVV